jgi:hypothetical protein
MFRDPVPTPASKNIRHGKRRDKRLWLFSSTEMLLAWAVGWICVNYAYLLRLDFWWYYPAVSGGLLLLLLMISWFRMPKD